MATNRDSNLRETPLTRRHIEAGAKMAGFAGWNMPIQYEGIIAEHMHTRTQAGLFDTCHMGEFHLRGPAAASAVDRLVTCRTDNLANGQCRYGFLLNDEGGVIDDLIVFRIAPEEFMLVVNAGTREKDRDWIASRISSEVDFQDDSDRTAKLDLQGPKSREVIATLMGSEQVHVLRFFRFDFVSIQDVRVLLSRTGYTGELGYELYFPTGDAESIWDALLDFDVVKPVGLGARDTLRLEKGLPLYGQDLNDKRTPLEANFGRFVFMDKEFVGKEALLRQKKNGVEDSLIGFVCEGRRSARADFEIRSGERTIGSVTSGAFSPCLKRGIGMGYVRRDAVDEGQELEISKGKAIIKATMQHPPFV